MATDNKRARELIDAVMLEDRPCDLCEQIQRCAAEKLACLAFERFISSGLPSYSAGMNPRRVIYERIYKDGNDEAPPSKEEKAEAKLMRELSKTASRLSHKINTNCGHKGTAKDGMFVIVATSKSFKALVAESTYNRASMQDNDENIVGYYRSGGVTKLEIYDDIEHFNKTREACSNG